MRLNQFEIDAITTVAKQHFGNEVHVSLFGSRTDDSKKGGDIDLFISSSDEQYLNLKAKIEFLADLKQRIGDRKIDVVFNTIFTRQKKAFYQSICSQQIDLSAYAGK
jgi:predicted nucleotidyltransferase